MGTQMYRNWTSVIARSFLSWLLPALCAVLLWTSLSATDRHNEVSIVYISSASVLGGLAMSKDNFAVPAFMMLVIGTLNLLISSSNTGAVKYSSLLAPLCAILAFALLLVAIWKPLRLMKPALPFSSSRVTLRTRAIAATCLSLFVPLVCLTVPTTLNQASQSGSSATILSWSPYMYALFFTGLSYGLAALIWVWPPSALGAKDIFYPQMFLLFVATFLGSAYFENLVRDNWTAFVFSQIGVLGTITAPCFVRLRAVDTALSGRTASDRGRVGHHSNRPPT